MHARRSRGEPVALRLAVHPALPSPEIAGGQEVREGHSLGDGHDLPGRVVEQLRKAHDQPLLGRHTEAFCGMAIRDVLEERLWVDRLAALPVDDCRDAADLGVEIHCPRVAAELAVHRALDCDGV